jgi:hypothetical protein
MQNKEKSIRQMYIADEGYSIVQFDQAGAEALIVAYECENGNLRSLFLNGVKPHVFVALRNFPTVWLKRFPCADTVRTALTCTIPELKTIPQWKELDTLIKDSDNWPSDQRYYYLGKQSCHSLNYDARETAFQMNVLQKSGGSIVLSREDSSKLINGYHSLFTEIRKWHRVVVEYARKYGRLYNLFGYPLQITQSIEESMYKELYALIPQSTVGTITNIAYTQLLAVIENDPYDDRSSECLRLFGNRNRSLWRPWQNNHDSYVCMVPDSDVEECAKIMKFLIEVPLVSSRGEKFNMRSEGAVGKNWAAYKQDKNPNGLKEIKI